MFLGHLDDQKNWRRLAKARGVKLPPYAAPCTPRKIRLWLRRLKLSTDWFSEWTGIACVDNWIVMNPDWGLRAFIGLLLEESEA